MSNSARGFSYAVLADAHALVELIRSAYRGDVSRQGWASEADLVAGDRIDESGVRDLITAPGSTLLVLRDGTDMVACCQLEHRGEGLVYFGTFAVAPRAQARGVGRRLMAEAERVAKTKFTACTLEMTVLAQQDRLIGYYERRGFHRTGETRPFPADPVFARPLVNDLRFVVLQKRLTTTSSPGETGGYPH